MTLLINTLQAVSVRLWNPWQGTWTADVDYNLEAGVPAPSGRCTLTIGNDVLVGYVDPDSSGTVIVKGRCRVLGGLGGGWHRNVEAQDFSNAAGVLSSSVYSATAAALGETVVDLSTISYGTHYVRSAGPASRVFWSGGKIRDWYVDLHTGVTFVGPWPTSKAPDDLEVLDWAPDDNKLDVASTGIVLPGMVITDARIGTQTCRDVSQTFSAEGARATIWTGEKPRAKLQHLLTSLVREHAHTIYARTFRYSVFGQDSDGLTLVSLDPRGMVPDLVKVPIWYGLPGAVCVVPPGIEASVTFLNGDPTQPVVTGFYGGTELASGVATDLSLKAVMLSLGLLATCLTAFSKQPLVQALDTTPGPQNSVTLMNVAAAAMTTALGAPVVSQFTKVL